MNKRQHYKEREDKIMTKGSATPRGFAKAVYEFNSQPVEEMA